MSVAAFEATKHNLYALQDVVTQQLQALPGSLADAKLCGGTALARCWLDHRASYDLDFFFPHGFKANSLAHALKQGEIAFEAREIIDDPYKANQLHGTVTYSGRSLNVSFIEDAYFDVFPAVARPMGPVVVATEDVAGLYHRKLRTVSGAGADGHVVVGGRQKARDLFDLYVLSKVHSPLQQFIASLPYAFPSDAFNNGLASMPWFDLADELSEIVCNPHWAQALDVGHIQQHLLEQIGAHILNDGQNHP